LKKTENAQIG